MAGGDKSEQLAKQSMPGVRQGPGREPHLLTFGTACSCAEAQEPCQGQKLATPEQASPPKHIPHWSRKAEKLNLVAGEGPFPYTARPDLGFPGVLAPQPAQLRVSWRLSDRERDLA